MLRSDFGLSDESGAVLKKYLAEFAISWPECREQFEEPVHLLIGSMLFLRIS